MALQVTVRASTRDATERDGSQPEASSMATAEELALIAQAAAALRHRQPALALPLVEQHALLFRRGALQQERAGMVVVALCQQGRFDEAQPLRQQFVVQAPHSPLVGSIARACDSNAP